MKTITFPYYVSFGKLDSVSSEIELSISDKDAKRLKKSAEEGGRFRLNEDEDLSDLYDKVYQEIIFAEKEVLLSDPSPVKDFLSWKDDYDPSMPISDEQIDQYLDELTIGINYPRELQMLERTASPRAKKKVVESIVVDRESASDYVYKNGNKDRIVLIDEGETLFYVPQKYSGLFIIPSSVKRIEKYVGISPFKNHKKITEVIIEDGLTEIIDDAFDGCENLEKITISGSVRRIGFNAFTKCSRLKHVVISEGITEIDSSAFRFCFDLEQLRIPASVETISMHITSYQAGIKKLIFEGLTTTIDDTMCRGDEWEKVTVYAKGGSVAESFAKEHGIKVEAIR